MRTTFLLLFFFVLTGYASGADGGKKGVSDSATMPVTYPTPPMSASRLFYVQRTPNANTIIYDLNIANNGKPDEDEPVKVYWIKYAERSQKEDLNFIQRRFAYGLNTTPLGNGNYDLRFVCYKKFKMTLMKAPDGKYRIFAVISQKPAILNRIFVKIDGGSFWIPNVSYVQVNGTDPDTGKEMVERFKP
ncbi:MAG: DUF4833 domain-containing protein [Bacteroidetes bacterium]|nr:DUF4833 domain-containing protein [Bacteroidota bacterium]